MSFLYFISTALTFWTTDYLTNVMNFDKDNVYRAFILITITGPLLGVIYGGIVVQKLFGGYEQRHSIAFVWFHLLIAGLLVIPIYFLNSLISLSIVIWLLLFFGGSTIPTLQGITISSLPHSLRASGNSMNNLLIYTLGFSAAPLFYGAIYDKTKDNDPRLAFVLTLSWGGVSFIFATLCAAFRYMKFNDSKSQENKNIEIQVIPLESIISSTNNHSNDGNITTQDKRDSISMNCSMRNLSLNNSNLQEKEKKLEFIPKNK